MSKEKKPKFFIRLSTGVEELYTYGEYRKRAKELGEQGIKLTYCISWKYGYDYMPDKTSFIERMRHIRAMGCGLFPMIQVQETGHYMSLNLYNRLARQKFMPEIKVG